MKRGFVRSLWGIHDHQGRRLYKRRSKIDNDIKLLKMNPWNEPYVCYTFGEDNHKYLLDEGIDSRLVDKKPIVWDMEKEQFRHKLEAFDQGMNDFDEMVFLDWDTLPTKPLPKDFWEVLGKKRSFQAILRIYHRKKATWRKDEQRKVPCASFVYCRDKAVTERLCEMWEQRGRPWSEEIIMARYMDEALGGWQGMDVYWDNFEPDFFYLDECILFSREQYKTKNRCFKHLNQKQVAGRLKRGWK